MGDVRIKDKDGKTYIAASRRPDGSWRKERKVKEGYIPQDEQPRYDPRMRLNRPTRNENDFNKLPVFSPSSMMKSRNIPKSVQNAKVADETFTSGHYNIPVAAIDKPNACITVKDQYERKVFNLRKKINDINTLVTKIDKGELKPQPNQLEKIKRRQEIENEITELLDKIEKM
uniref:Partner of Y14 and mago n=1 Tax=Parastrongyloides trichosuri TaxID=131310 RepID=A0A0N4ZU63_PARTI